MTGIKASNVDDLLISSTTCVGLDNCIEVEGGSSTTIEKTESYEASLATSIPQVIKNGESFMSQLYVQVLAGLILMLFGAIARYRWKKHH